MYKSLLESAKTDFFRNKFQLYPYEWDKLIVLIDSIKSSKIGIQQDRANEIISIFVSGEEVLRYDKYEMKMETDIPKQDIHLAILNKKNDKIKKYFK